MSDVELTPNVGLRFGWETGQDDWGGGVNWNWLLLDVVSVPFAKSITETTPPISPADGDRYIIPAGATGVWADKPGRLAYWTSGQWMYFQPHKGWYQRVWDTRKTYVFNGTAWEYYLDSITPEFMVEVNQAIAAGEIAAAAAVSTAADRNAVHADRVSVDETKVIIDAAGTQVAADREATGIAHTAAVAAAVAANNSKNDASTSAVLAGNFSQNATAAASSAGAYAGQAATSAAIAEAARDVTVAAKNDFINRNYGGLPSDPALRPDGTAVQEGDVYTNTTLDKIRVYMGSAWVNQITTVDLAGEDGAAKVGTDNSKTVQENLDALYSDFTNVSSIAAANIQSLISTIRTASAVTLGYGGSTFKRYIGPQAVDGYVVVQSADGAKWKSVDIPNPLLFGAVPGSDITVPMQRWITYAASVNEEVSWSIAGKISTLVTAVVATGAQNYSRLISGKLVLSEPSVNVDTLLFFDGFINTAWGDLEYVGSQHRSTQKVITPFIFKRCGYLTAASIHVTGCKKFGTDLQYYTTEFHIASMQTKFCGIGSADSGSGNTIPFAYTLHFRIGSVGRDQRSVFNVASIPDGLGVGDGIMVNKTYYNVRYVEPNQVQVYPALDTIDEAFLSGAYWVSGGGLRHSGGDTNAGYIGLYSGLGNGHDIVSDELFPVSIGKYNTQFSTVGLRLGLDGDHAYRGGSIQSIYSEGTNIAFVLLGQQAESPYSILQIGPNSAIVTAQNAQYVDVVGGTLVKNAERNLPVIALEGENTVVPYSMYRPFVSPDMGNTGFVTVSTQELAGGFGHVVQLTLDKVKYETNGAYSVLIAIVGSATGTPGVVTIKGDTGVTVKGLASVDLTLNPCMILAVYHNNNWTLFKSADMVKV